MLSHAGMRGLRTSASVLAVTLCVIAAGGPANAKAKFITIDPPGSEGSEALGINADGSITGLYVDPPHWPGAHGFVRAPDGTFKTFAYKAQDTRGLAINREGEIAGTSGAYPNKILGLVRTAKGKFNTFGSPNQKNFPSLSSLKMSINDTGIIAGSYSVPHDYSYAFVRSANGNVTAIVPNSAISTEVGGINNTGAIGGDYMQSDMIQYGFIQAADGTITSFYAPVKDCGGGTVVTGINDAGAATGSCPPRSPGLPGAFVRSPEGKFKMFDVEGAEEGSAKPQAINAYGVIAGEYLDSRGQQHGFVRAADGTIASFNPPGSKSTTVTGIDAAGDIVGSYTDAYGVGHGYLRTP